MFYRRLLVWLFVLIVSLFTGCVPIILFVLFYFPIRHWSIEKSERAAEKEMRRQHRYYSGIRRNKERNA
jgi:phosphotransferase system  glucose/maltose/N-acetylglucosamine-specific IIC component